MEVLNLISKTIANLNIKERVSQKIVEKMK